MTKAELRDKIKVLAKTVYRDRVSIEQAAVEYDELTKFPELKDVIVSLLGPQFDLFVASIDWVAPKPTTFRINLKNNENFYLVYTPRTFIAEIEGKKYYLLNLPEEERADEAISRMLRYGPAGGEKTEDDGDEDFGTEEVETAVEDTEEITDET